MLRESCEEVPLPTCDDSQREKAEDGCKGGIEWQGVADCVPWQAGVCHAGHREGSTAGLARAPQAKLRFFGGLITTRGMLSAHWVLSAV